MPAIEVKIQIPDDWQQDAIRALQKGKDVVVAAPTGAGKTYIFELLIENGFDGKAVYTVPTRALANDKMQEWSERSWRVGIATGDRSEHPDAPVIVATLETQKHRLLRGEGPELLVIDEYQMLADSDRGVNYELALASAPAETQLLLLSGSVANPGAVADWLRKLGREVVVIQHIERPVPLDEVYVEALPDRIPEWVRGFWPRAIARALKAEMAPLLAFAPRRKAAEDLAWQLARMLPEDDPLVLSPAQQKLAGTALTRLLRARIAFHHSGLDYGQRAGLIEPLAKAGQLRVVVATMGLAAGINFSMRSVLVTDREYRSGDATLMLRPDELLQMFGRAGRRGLDKNGYIIVAPNKPRLTEAHPLTIRRSERTDWPSLITVMDAAARRQRDPVAAAHALSSRLFSTERIPLGLRDFRKNGPPAIVRQGNTLRQKVIEIQNPDGAWERRRALQNRPLSQAWIFDGVVWLPALCHPGCLENVQVGTLCHLKNEGARVRYGREVAIARLGQNKEEGELVLTRWTLQALRKNRNGGKSHHPSKRKGWTLDKLEQHILPALPQWTQGGTLHEIKSRKDLILARLDYSNATVQAYVDSQQRALINPPVREIEHEANFGGFFGNAPDTKPAQPRSSAEAWYQLGLIDSDARPTRRGRIFSFFNHGEGLAIAAALEDVHYDIEEMICHIANLRAGHRFGDHQAASSRLGIICRSTYHNSTYPGYLRQGLPLAYGDGAAEVIFGKTLSHLNKWDDDQILRSGDIERAQLEWRSLLQHIAAAPELEWDRWLQFKQAAMLHLDRLPPSLTTADLPPLTPSQRKRHKSFLRF